MVQVDHKISQLATDVEVGDLILAREDEDNTTVDLGTIKKTDGKSQLARTHLVITIFKKRQFTIKPSITIKKEDRYF